MKTKFFLSFICLGLTSIISQLTIIRELIISFYGNEVFIGISLASWLLWVAIGAIIGSKIKYSRYIYFWTIFLVPFLFFAEILLIRVARIFLSNFGQAPNLLLSSTYTFLVMAPLCLFLGLQFSLGSRFWLKIIKNKTISQLINKVYLFENIGFIIGGFFFVTVLIKINIFPVILIIAFINFLILLFLSSLCKTAYPKYIISLLLLTTIFITFSPKVSSFDKVSNNWRYVKQDLIISENSLYNNIAITKQKQQYGFYVNGTMIADSSTNLADEILVHFPLLFTNNPDNILLIGSGLQNAITEILKHPVNSIYYIELDSKLIELSYNFLNQTTQNSLINEKVRIINQDAVHFLKNNKTKFDVIITNLGNPNTIALNRYYSSEFFNLAAEHLSENGIFASWLNSSPNYINKTNTKLIASTYYTLKNNFSHILILPEEKIYFLASQTLLSYDSAPLINKYQSRQLNNKLVTPEYINYRMNNDRIMSTFISINKETTSINQNLTPNTYFFQNLFWVNHFHPKLANTALKLLQFTWLHWLIILAILLYAINYIIKKKKLNPLPFTALIPDFTLFTLEIILLLIFQSIYGYVYSQIAIIITLLMTGMVIGNFLGMKINSKYQITISKLRYLYLMISIYCLSLPFIFTSLLNIDKVIGVYIIFPAVALTIGILNGLEFPLTNHLYLQKSKIKKISAIYSSDQIGSAIGALLATIILIPIIGINYTIIFLVILNLFAIFLLSTTPKYQES